MRIIDARSIVLVVIMPARAVLLGSELDGTAVGQDQVSVHTAYVQLQKTFTDSRRRALRRRVGTRSHPVTTIPGDCTKSLHSTVREHHRVALWLEISNVAGRRILQDPIIIMVPTTGPTKHLGCAGCSRIAAAHEGQWIITHRAGNGNISYRARCISGVGIIGASRIDLPIKHAGSAGGIVVSNLSKKILNGKSKKQSDKSNNRVTSRVRSCGSYTSLASVFEVGCFKESKEVHWVIPPSLPVVLRIARRRRCVESPHRRSDQ